MSSIISKPIATPTVYGSITSFAPTCLSVVKSVSSANYVILDNDGYLYIDVSTGASQRTITFPAVGTNAGRSITITKTDNGAGTILVDTPGAETINGAAQNVIYAQYGYATYYCDGSNWFVRSCWDYVSAVPGGNVTPAASGSSTEIITVAVGQGTWSLCGGGYLTFGTAVANTDFQLRVAPTGSGGGGTAQDTVLLYAPSASVGAATFIGQVGPMKVTLTSVTTEALIGTLRYGTLGSMVFTNSSIIWATRVG